MDKKRFNELRATILRAKIEMAKLWPAALRFANGHWQEVDPETPHCFHFDALGKGFAAIYFNPENGIRTTVGYFGEIIPKD